MEASGYAFYTILYIFTLVLVVFLVWICLSHKSIWRVIQTSPTVWTVERRVCMGDFSTWEWKAGHTSEEDALRDMYRRAHEEEVKDKLQKQYRKRTIYY